MLSSWFQFQNKQMRSRGQGHIGSFTTHSIYGYDPGADCSLDILYHQAAQHLQFNYGDCPTSLPANVMFFTFYKGNQNLQMLP